MARTLLSKSWKKTNANNTGCGSTAGSDSINSSFNFTVDTITGTPSIKQVTKITVSHYHSCISTPTIKLNINFLVNAGIMEDSSLTVLRSNNVSHTFSGDVYRYTNTFWFGTDSAGDTISEETTTSYSNANGKYTAKTGIRLAKYLAQNKPTFRIGCSGKSGSGSLYSRATSDYPMTVAIYYYDTANEPKVLFVNGDPGYTRSISNSIATFSVPVKYYLTGDSEALTSDDGNQSLKLYYTTDGTEATPVNGTEVTTSFTSRSASAPGNDSSPSVTFSFQALESDSVSMYVKYIYAQEDDGIIATYIGSMPNIPLHLSGTGNGVAIGGYSTATAADKRFDCYYPAYFHNGIGKMYSVGTDPDNSLVMQAGFSSPGTYGRRLCITRIGNMCFLAGSVKRTTSGKQIMFTFPKELAPIPGDYAGENTLLASNGACVFAYAVGSGNYAAKVRVYTKDTTNMNGYPYVDIQWHHITSSADDNTGTFSWLDIQANWFIETE